MISVVPEMVPEVAVTVPSPMATELKEPVDEMVPTSTPPIDQCTESVRFCVVPSL